MNELPYQTLSGVESGGQFGTLGIRIQVQGSKLPDLKLESIEIAAYNALRDLNDVIVGEIIARDPKMQAEAALCRANMLSCFEGPIYVEEIPNGYSNGVHYKHLPWFIVTTRVGRIKIGGRKRVIQIDWTDTRGTSDSDTLFHNEVTTKDERMIHAHSLEEARRYVAAIVASGTNAISVKAHTHAS